MSTDPQSILCNNDRNAVKLKRKAMLRAYKQRPHISENEMKTSTVIRSLSPMKSIPESTYNHSPGSLFGRRTQPDLPVDSWWKKSAAIAGESQNKVQMKLSDVDSFTGVNRKRVTKNRSSSVSGDFIPHDPLKAIRLLRGSDLAHLTIPGRAADFTNEVQWRLTLRDKELN